MTTIAALAITLALGGWLGMRFTREWDRIDTDLATFLLTVDIDRSQWAERDLVDEGDL